MLKNILISIRPRQWYKNVLLFVGIVFSANILNVSMWPEVLLAFVYFCMLSAGEYLINDILDRERDRIHPVKSQRPIASGRLRVEHALLIALSLIVLSLAGAYLTINLNFFIISASYMLLIIIYSLILKHLVIVDVLVISAGFVIRAMAGVLAIDLFPSSWLIICVFLLALFLALEKRWCELVTLTDKAVNHRRNLNEYSTKMLEQLVGITTAVLIVSFLMYTFSSEYDAMLLSAPFVIYGLFRYLYLVHNNGISAEPEVVFKDKAMLANLSLWVLMVVSIILYDVLA